MSDFSLGRTFDLIYMSANTLRCVTQPDAITRMWHCIANHLRPGGAFVADLEVGVAAEAARVNQPTTWTISRDQTLVRVRWTIITAPNATTRCCEVEWTFELRTVQDDTPARLFREVFPLRTYEAHEIVGLAAAEGLAAHGAYLLRDPYLSEVPIQGALGRILLVLRRS
jgi:hypothetical protein